jgi:extradiol dioxygenase family protein
MSASLPPFHVAIPVSDLAEARAFYRTVLGCSEGRSDTQWVDFNFFGHQLVIHETEGAGERGANPVDGHAVPVPHYGVVLEWEAWHALAEGLKQQQVTFLIEPYLRFEGLPGEQATLFIADPSGNALEFKSFKDPGQLFAT